MRCCAWPLSPHLPFAVSKSPDVRQAKVALDWNHRDELSVWGVEQHSTGGGTREGAPMCIIYEPSRVARFNRKLTYEPSGLV